MFRRCRAVFRISATAAAGSAPTPATTAAPKQTAPTTNGGGHEVTLNGFGVMMNNTSHDPFVKGWIDRVVTQASSSAPLISEDDDSTSTTTTTTTTEKASHHEESFRALEIGAAFGAATLTAMQTVADSSSSTGPLRYRNISFVANDIDQGHLDAIMKRSISSSSIGKNQKEDEEGEQHNNNKQTVHLETWQGRVPDCLMSKARTMMMHQQKERCLGSTNTDNDTSPLCDSDDNNAEKINVEQQQLEQKQEQAPPPPLFDVVLAANVFHFLTPRELHDTLNTLNKLCKPGAHLYISLDSPFTKAFRPFLPFYYLKQRILRYDYPGAFRVSKTLRRIGVVPKRLRSVDVYHVMETRQLVRALSESGWVVKRAELFSGDAEGNPAGVSLGNGIEMVGAWAVKKQ